MRDSSITVVLTYKYVNIENRPFVETSDASWLTQIHSLVINCGERAYPSPQGSRSTPIPLYVSLSHPSHTDPSNSNRAYPPYLPSSALSLNCSWCLHTQYYGIPSYDKHIPSLIRSRS